MSDTPYLIKKYTSRRLYDVAAGRFLTLDDLYALIRDGRRIKAVDAAGKDITRSVLLQVLADREESGQPLLSTDALHDMVRMYGEVTQSLFTRFMDEGLASLVRQQQALQGNLQETLRRSTAAAMGQVLEQQGALLKSGQDLVLGLLRGKKATTASVVTPSPAAAVAKKAKPAPVRRRKPAP